MGAGGRQATTGRLGFLHQSSHTAAAELPHVDLGDALAVCVAIRGAEPHRYERAALDTLRRLCS
jgi:hypothetical protein